MSQTPRRALARARSLALFLALLTSAAPASARQPTSQEIVDLNQMAQDPSRAAEALALARRLAADDIDANYRLFLRQMIVQSMMRAGSPSKELAGAADTLDRMPELNAQTRLVMLGNVAEMLADRGEELDRARSFAHRALLAVPPGQAFDETRAMCEAILGDVQLAQGDVDSAVASLSHADLAAPENATVLFHLGRAHEAKRDTTRAIDAYIRALGVFPVQDTSAFVPLRALYSRKHGGLDGMHERIKTLRKSATVRNGLEPHRYERPAPAWTLHDLQGRPMRSADFHGKVVVVDFWGSWCGPCRAELPHFQKSYEKWKDRGVAFVGISWERQPTAEDAKRVAKSFVEANGYTFPVVLDAEHKASRDYDVESFPTVFLIDKTGSIRYRNIGFDPAIAQILTAQIESLLE